MLTEVLRQIERRDDFLLTSHARPDGDAIGSALACCQVLRAMGKQAEVVMHDPVPVIYRPLPFSDQVRESGAVNGRYEAAIILECDSVQRTRLEGLDPAVQFLINIDHHSTARPFAHINWIDPAACATAEMVYRLACEAGVKISADVATCLYTAVLTDTGSFAYSGTNERTFALAQELVRLGANPALIARNVYFSNPLSKMKLLGAALDNLHRSDNVTCMHVTRADMERCHALDEDAEGLVNYALSVAGVEVAVFFRELGDGRWRVSLRSKGRVNVAAVAEGFGGGGHECASGFSLDGPLSEATDRVRQALANAPPRKQGSCT
ncbi:MAG TPA: bifunctional oligoribonuclease/PAP phosphatase NrnA [Terriglobales bacterium]|nr:bifunctional oligoribonuclease/PAP phosphatase NrnA [Terriglobales bacterium]